MRVRKYETKEFVVPQQINRIPNWNNPKLWEISDIVHFPEWYQELVLETRKEVEEYYNTGLASHSDEQFQQSTRTLRRLARHLSNGMNIKEALFKSNGWKGSIGFAYAIYHMKLYYDENDIYPTISPKSKFEQIRKSAEKGYWTGYNIQSWNDLMMFVFNERNDVKYAIEGGLEKAIDEMKDYHEKYSQLPTSKDLVSVNNAVCRGLFEEDGIFSWNELMLYVFDEVNIAKGLYEGIEGFERAKKALLEFQQEFDELPIISHPDMVGISNAISRGNFKQFNINRWNDLMRSVFGKVNVNTRRYMGKKGLEIAKYELREYHKRTGELPSHKNKEFVSIINAAHNERWKKFGIKSFNDLLMYVFGEVNRVSPNTYVGFKGLHFVQGVLIKFYDDNERLPVSADEGMNGINGSISRGYYVSHGIKTWNDLLKVTFGELNHRQNIYGGKEGLEFAKQEMIEFEKKHKRLPKSTEMQGITGALKRKEWAEFGVTSWNQLMKELFGRYNFAGHRGKYYGEKGLQTAIEELKAVEKRERRLPQANDKGIGGIRQAIKKGKFREFEVDNWSELLFKAFGTKYKNIKLKGERGFEQAIKIMKQFESENGRLPGNKDKDVQAVVRAIDRRDFHEFGVRVWNDMLKHVFDRVNLRSFVFTGEDGFANAERELITLKINLGRLPNANDAGIGGIVIAIKRGEWHDLGIYRWNDMMDRVFGEVNHRIYNLPKRGDD
ncbi:MAG: hypothetical protein OEY49_06135 [Candidatus Heimdallarchaeota archaeon]|nr:hypothetical protein [Candidatus Heimdallarchaeota archaeon]